MLKCICLSMGLCFLVTGWVTECRAHGGGLDSNGGHNSASGYHYHSGGFSAPPKTYSFRKPKTTFRPKTAVRSSSRTTARVEIRKPRVKPRVKARWEHREVDFKYVQIMDDGKCKVMLYIKVIVDRSTLVAVAKEIGQERVSFYLPGMNGAGEPWASARRSSSTGRYGCSYFASMV